MSYWFRQKSFGYGATPSTWQGWLFTFVSVALVIGVVMGAELLRDNTLRFLAITAGLLLILVPTVAIAHAKTEGGWRWRSGR